MHRTIDPSSTPEQVRQMARASWERLRPFLAESLLDQNPWLRRQPQHLDAIIDEEVAWWRRDPAHTREFVLLRLRSKWTHPDQKTQNLPERLDFAPDLAPIRRLDASADGNRLVDLVLDYSRDKIHGQMAVLKQFLPGACAEESPPHLAVASLMVSLDGIPGVVRLLTAGALATPAGIGSYLVVEYLPGRTLQNFIDRPGTYAVVDCLRVFLAVARTLVTIHNRGRLHLDIKPANIGFAENGSPVLFDFDLGQNTLQQTRSVGGYSPPYTPPEWLVGEPVSPVGEVYCLAASLYHLLFKELPFQAAVDSRDPTVLVDAKIREQLSPARGDWRDCPPRLIQFLKRALDGDLGQRVPDMVTFARELEEILIEMEPPPPGLAASLRAEPEKPAANRPSRRNLLALLAGGSGVVILASGVWKFWPKPEGSPRPPGSEPSRQPVTPRQIELAEAAFLNGRPSKSTRFLHLDHRHNDPDVTAADLLADRTALNDLLEVLAGQKVAVEIVPDTQETAFAFDLASVGWTAGHWSDLARRDPYWLRPQDTPSQQVWIAATRKIEAALGTEHGSLRADWFVYTLSRPPLATGKEVWPESVLALREAYPERQLSLAQLAREARVPDTESLRQFLSQTRSRVLKILSPVLVPHGTISRRVWESPVTLETPGWFVPIPEATPHAPPIWWVVGEMDTALLVAPN